MKETVVVTGGAKGIGRAISSLFAESGYNVLINYNTSENDALNLKQELLNKGMSVEIFKADISIKSDAEELIDFAYNTFGSVDILINNAGIAQQKLISDIDENEFNTMISTNLSGVFYCCQAASRYLIKKHKGSIVNISSIWGVSGASMEVHYSASKAGVIGLTKALAKELGPSSIRVNCVAPGVIDTDMNKTLSAETLFNLKNDTPLCRTGKPIEVAEAVFFLASDKASFITGQILTVDGGFSV